MSANRDQGGDDTGGYPVNAKERATVRRRYLRYELAKAREAAASRGRSGTCSRADMSTHVTCSGKDFPTRCLCPCHDPVDPS